MFVVGEFSSKLCDIVVVIFLLARFVICLSNVFKFGLFLVTTFIFGQYCK